jgi:hypothetical protein
LLYLALLFLFLGVKVYSATANRNREYTRHQRYPEFPHILLPPTVKLLFPDFARPAIAAIRIYPKGPGFTAPRDDTEIIRGAGIDSLKDISIRLF